MRTHRALVWVCTCVLTLRGHVRGCGGARVAVTDALGGAKGGGRWTALEGGIVTVATQTTHGQCEIKDCTVFA